MAMKKKFLGLALAAAVALPATTAYAANDTQSIEMGKNETQNVTVPVSGSIRNKQGAAPEGRIEVELPTKMAFTVDQDGNLPNTTYTVQNKSQGLNIDLSVASFSGGSDSAGNSTGIKLHAAGQVSGDRANKYRNEVELKLTNSKDNTEIDLGNFNTSGGNGTKLATINAGETKSIVLSGVVGTKSSSDASSHSSQADVDSKGATEDFNLVFSIKKNG